MNDRNLTSSATAGASQQPFGSGSGVAAFYGRVDLSDPLLPASQATRFASGHGSVCIEAPGIQIHVDPARVDCSVHGSTVTLCAGAPRIVGGGARAGAADVARELSRRGRIDAGWLRGRFAVVHLDMRARTITLATDRFGVHPVCYSCAGPTIAFSDRADALSTDPSRLDWQALYDYIYFHVIPAPRTVYRDVARLEPAQVVDFGVNGEYQRFWWEPRFEPDAGLGPEGLKRRFTELLEAAVARSVDTDRIGSFLSGGTDSSTVVGFLGRVTGRRPKTFSIGFDAAGYDEMAYARIVARHFGAEHHEYYVTPDDLVHAIPVVAAYYDQPFGNSSALPAYYCALRAKEAGVERLLAGDGGDELFGGNTRYVTQKIFEAYSALPRALRGGLVEPLLLGRQWPLRVPPLRKLVRYVEQARVPMPDRMETYNLLDRFGPASVFTDRFLSRVDTGAPRELQRAVYGRVQAASLIDRMLSFDWRFTLADNDLPKVTGTTGLAGVAVGFPLLDDDIVDFSLRLAPALKVRGLRLRYFFKEALSGFLPVDVIRKRKHGFGLPFGPWLTSHQPLRALARGALAGLVERGVVRRELTDELLSVRLREHAGYFGEMVWILMMLEHWLAAKAPDFAV